MDNNTTAIDKKLDTELLLKKVKRTHTLLVEEDIYEIFSYLPDNFIEGSEDACIHLFSRGPLQEEISFTYDDLLDHDFQGNLKFLELKEVLIN